VAPDDIVRKGLSRVPAGCRRALDWRPGRAAGGSGRERAGHAAPHRRGRRRRERAGRPAGAAGARAPLARGPCRMRHARCARGGELCNCRMLVRVHACATSRASSACQLPAAPEAAPRPSQDAARALQGSQAQVQGCQAALRRHGAAGARIVTPQALCELAANCQARCAGTASSAASALRRHAPIPASDGSVPPCDLPDYKNVLQNCACVDRCM